MFPTNKISHQGPEEKEVDYWRKKTQEWKTQLQAINEQTKLQNENNKLRDKVLEMKELINNQAKAGKQGLEAKISSTEKELERSRTLFRHTERENFCLKEKVNAFEKEKIQLREEVLKLKTALKNNGEKDQQRIDIGTETRQLKIDISTQKRIVELTRKEADMLKEKVKTLENENRRLFEAYEAAEDKIRKLSKYEQEFQEIEKINKENLSQIISLKEQNQFLLEKKNELLDSRDVILLERDRLKDNEGKLNEKIGDIEKWKELVEEEYNRKIDFAHNSISNLKEENEYLEKENLRIINQCDQEILLHCDILINERIQFEGQIQKLNEEKAFLFDLAEKCEYDLREAVAKENEYQQEIENIRLDNEELKNQVERLAQIQKEIKQEKENTEKEARSLKEEVLSLETNLREAEEKLKEAREKEIHFKLENEEMSNKLAEFNELQDLLKIMTLKRINS